MTVRVPAFHPGEMLKDFYLEPLNLTPIKLAKILGVDRQRIQRLVSGECGLSVETANLLGKAFSTSPQYWMNMQIAWDMQQAENDAELQGRIDAIEPIDIDALAA